MADRYYVETYTLQPDRKVRIRLPAMASDEERRQVDEAGWELA